MATSNSDRWPVDPRTSQPIPPKEQPGYYPGYHTLSQQAFWDEATRTVVLDRVNNIPPIRFFTGDDEALMRAIIERLLPQDDRIEQRKVPILNYVDRKVYEKKIPGYQYENMPPLQESYRLGLQAIEQIAQHMHGRRFVELGPREQDETLKTIHDGKPPAAHDIWKRMSVGNFWTQMMHDVAEAYYAHPYAWDEIGYGGPAYPRGYMRLERGEPEPYEKQESRYAWIHPPTALSGELDETFESAPHPQAHRPGGQGGTH
jgi:hypothetical protein